MVFAERGPSCALYEAEGSGAALGWLRFSSRLYHLTCQGFK
jgi:hypothetical protein